MRSGGGYGTPQGRRPHAQFVTMRRSRRACPPACRARTCAAWLPTQAAPGMVVGRLEQRPSELLLERAEALMQAGAVSVRAALSPGREQQNRRRSAAR